jgi:hypothetical protein
LSIIKKLKLLYPNSQMHGCSLALTGLSIDLGRQMSPFYCPY